MHIFTIYISNMRRVRCPILHNSALQCIAHSGKTSAVILTGLNVFHAHLRWAKWTTPLYWVTCCEVKRPSESLISWRKTGLPCHPFALDLRQPVVPRTSWSPALRYNFVNSLQLRASSQHDWTPCSDAYFTSPLALAHDGYAVRPHGYRGLTAFASLMWTPLCQQQNG